VAIIGKSIIVYLSMIAVTYTLVSLTMILLRIAFPIVMLTASGALGGLLGYAVDKKTRSLPTLLFVLILATAILILGGFTASTLVSRDG
jgi:hypothetical protein